MESNMNVDVPFEQDSKSNFGEIVFKYLSYWKLYVFVVVVSLASANLYLRYSVPIYEANAAIKIKDNQKGGSGISETSAFDDLTIFKDGNSIENEKFILSSRDLMRKVVIALNLKVEYYALGNVTGFKRSEIYKEAPIQLEMLGTDSIRQFHSNRFIIKVLNNKTFEFQNMNGNVVSRYSFDQKIKVYSNMVVGRQYEIGILPIESCIGKYLSGLKIVQSGNTSAILKMFLQNPSKEKAIDILNMIIVKYNEDAIFDKNLISKNTSDFINDRIKLISKELGDVEQDIKDFKEKNKLVDIEYESKTDVNSAADIRNNIVSAETQVQLSRMMLEHLISNNAPDDLIPVNLGLADNTIDRTIEAHNSLVMERLEELKTTTEKAPKVVNLTKRFKI
jgi:tyrosine-protein kinase Etk/Wzc